MGHISNPIGFRLGLSRAWQAKIVPRGFNYQEDLYNQMSAVMRAYFCNRRFQRKGIIYSHSFIKTSAFCRLFATAFLYDARFELFVARMRSLINKHLRRKRAHRAKLVRGTPDSLRDPLLKYLLGTYQRRLRRLLHNFLFLNFRYNWWRCICLRIQQNVSLNLNSPNALNIAVQPFSNHTLTARAVGVYAIRKLKANNRLNEIFKPIMRHLSKLFVGFRVICRGRFTRNQRATLLVFNSGSTKLSTFSSDIDYYHTATPLKYGASSLKIWINHGFRKAGSFINKPTYFNL